MNFDQAIQYVLQNEGGFIDNPHDSGKATNFGITIEMLAVFRGGGVTREDVKALTLNEAKMIYRKYFWDQLKLESLPQVYATALLDMSVNMGEKKAVEICQKALGSTSCDGILGPQTVSALLHTDPKEFIFNYVSGLQDHYVDLVLYNPSEACFLKGWIRRALRLFHLIET